MIGRILKALRPWPTHPIDRQYGIETSRRVRRFRMRTGDPTADQSNVGYVGSQPSIVRACLDLLPDLSGAAFFDLGCGKGRILSVATEYPFQSITGMELSKVVFRTAARNAAHIAKRFPGRTPIQVLNANASRPPLPRMGTVVVFLYNPFHGDVTSTLVRTLESDLGECPGLKIFVVYYNPVQAELFDKSSLFSRYHAALHSFSKEEQNSSPFENDYDSVVIWQSRSEPMAVPRPGANRVVEVEIPDLAAIVRHDSETPPRPIDDAPPGEP
jgi:SAM-dependent methyltransferase